MNLNFNIETNSIANDDEYFFWLGQISSFICSHSQNNAEASNNRFLFLDNNRTDASIIKIIKFRISLLNHRSSDEPQIKNFGRIFCKVLNYNAPINKPIHYDGNHFHLGFYSECLF